MQFSISATLFTLALATLSVAAPTANPVVTPYDWNKGWDGKVTPIEEIGEDVPQPGITKRTLGLVYVCPAYDWQPSNGVGCSHVQWAYSNQCVRMSDQYYRWTLSAVGPDPGTWCVLYQSTDCSSGGSNGFTNPGMGRLDGYWSPWNDNTGSIKCWW